MGALRTQIGRYRIDRLLGSGSMGNVYLAHDADLDRPVAIKTLRDLVLDAEMRETFLGRFRNEARAAARLHHPNIVQIFDVGEDPEVGPYLVFEYVEGHTLKQELKKRGPLPPERLLEVARQVGDALATAHAAGVIHRDLKPENLLITRNGQVKLADFGIARVPNADLTKEGQFLGTPCYSAPETLRSGEYSELSDIFSFGAVVYEAASGERAFPGTEAMAVAHQVMNKDPMPPSEANRGAAIAPTVDAAILRALGKRPSSRYASARTFVSALQKAYEGVKPPRIRHKSMRTRLMIVVVLALLGSAWWIVDTYGPERFDASGPDGGSTGGAGGRSSARAEVPDAGPGSLSPHEREEAAKDQLARARDALARGDVAAATAALERAAELDPSNPDIEALHEEVSETPALDGG